MSAQLTVATADGRSFVRKVDRDEFTVGRDSRNHLVLGDRQVSKFHCILVKQKSDYVVKDLGSSNGTLVNGIRVTGEVAVTAGDRIFVGPYELVFGGAAEEEEPSYLRKAREGAAPAGREGSTAPQMAAAVPTPRWEDGRPVEGPGTSGAPSAPRAVSLPGGTPTPPRTPTGDLVTTDRISDSSLSMRSGRAYLEILDGDGKGHMITIGSRGVTIGAGSRNHLILDDPFVSRQHCRVDKEQDHYRVRDLGSTNGIRVDGKDLPEAPLTDGTKLQVGGVLMVFRWPDQPADTSQVVREVPPPRARPDSVRTPPHPVPATPPAAAGQQEVTARSAGPGIPQGRVAATQPEAPALSTPTLTMSGGGVGRRTHVGTEVMTSQTERGIVRIGPLRFRRWQAALLVVFGLLMVVALLYQAVISTFDLGGGGDGVTVTPEQLFQAGIDAYRAGDWETAESYFEKIGPDDPNVAEAQEYLETIRHERANAEKVETIATLVEEGFFHRAWEISKEIPATSRYYEDAQVFVAKEAKTEAARLVEEAVIDLEAGELDEASELIGLAAQYDPEAEGIDEIREAIERGPRAARAFARDRRSSREEVADDGSAGTRPTTSSSPRAATGSKGTRDRAISTYLAGDVDGARAVLEKGISGADAAGKLDLQDLLGRIDRIEGAYSAGRKAMDAGDLNVALDRFQSAYRDLNSLDRERDSERMTTVRMALAECHYRRGAQQFERRRYSRANKEWESGRKAWANHEGIQKGRKDLESIARDIYNDAYLAEKEGTDRGLEKARRRYEEVLEIAPRGDGFEYYSKAKNRLEGLP